jgi:cell division protein FtsL
MSIDVEYAIKKDVRNNPIVREVDRVQRREFMRALRIGALVIAMLLFAAWQHFEIVDTSRQMEELRQERSQEVEINRQLRLELETLRRPQEIERRATHELHMRPAAPADTLVIERAPARSASTPRNVVASQR